MARRRSQLGLGIKEMTPGPTNGAGARLRSPAQYTGVLGTGTTTTDGLVSNNNP